MKLPFHGQLGKNILFSDLVPERLRWIICRQYRISCARRRCVGLWVWGVGMALSATVISRV